MAVTSHPIAKTTASSQRVVLRGEWFQRILLWIAVTAAVVFAAYPFLWAILTSFKTQHDALQSSFIPFVQFQPTLYNWNLELNIGGAATYKGLGNSLLIASGATLIATILGTPAGYALARYRYGMGNRNLVAWFMSQRFMPPVATLIPYLLLYRSLGLLDKQIGLILIETTFVLPFAVLVMRDYFADFPSELEDAALVDGATHWQLFWKVAFPLCLPALMATIMICFAFAWNEAIFGAVLTRIYASPYPVQIIGLQGTAGVQFGAVGVRMLLAVALPVTLSLFLQRYIVRGLTFGAVKG